MSNSFPFYIIYISYYSARYSLSSQSVCDMNEQFYRLNIVSATVELQVYGLVILRLHCGKFYLGSNYMPLLLCVCAKRIFIGLGE